MVLNDIQKNPANPEGILLPDEFVLAVRIFEVLFLFRFQQRSEHVHMKPSAIDLMTRI